MAHLNLLGDHGLQDTGIQATWLPELPFYTLLGAELLQGEQERFGAFIKDSEEREETGLSEQVTGPRLWTVFAKVSPNLGYDHALQLGVSYLHNRQHQEIHASEAFENGLEGKADLWGLDLIYKYENNASYGYRSFKIQSEYLRSTKKLKLRGDAQNEMGSALKYTTDGWYIQGVYGIAPRWQTGLRYDVLGLTNKVTGGENKDPVRMARIGLALAKRLAELDPNRATVYNTRAVAFSNKMNQRMPTWKSRTATAPGVVLYHTDTSYLLDHFNVPLLGLMEPIPGIPPSATYLKELTDSLKGHSGIVLFTTYQPQQAPLFIAKTLDWHSVRLPLEPPLEADGDIYLDHIDRWVKALVPK